MPRWRRSAERASMSRPGPQRRPAWLSDLSHLRMASVHARRAQNVQTAHIMNAWPWRDPRPARHRARATTASTPSHGSPPCLPRTLNVNGNDHAVTVNPEHAAVVGPSGPGSPGPAPSTAAGIEICGACTVPANQPEKSQTWTPCRWSKRITTIEGPSNDRSHPAQQGLDRLPGAAVATASREC